MNTTGTPWQHSLYGIGPEGSGRPWEWGFTGTLLFFFGIGTWSEK